MHVGVVREATMALAENGMEKLMGNGVGTLGLRGELLYAIIYGLIKFDVNARATPCHVGLL